MRQSYCATILFVKSEICNTSLTRIIYWRKNVNINKLPYIIAICVDVLLKFVSFELILQNEFHDTNSNIRINTFARRTLKKSKQILRVSIEKLRHYFRIHFLFIEINCSKDTNSKSISIFYNIKLFWRTIDFLKNKENSAKSL